MTDYTGIYASAVHARCRYGNVPPSLMTWHDQSHCRGEMVRANRYQTKSLITSGVRVSPFNNAAPEPLAVLTARRERVLTGLMAEWAKRAGPAFRASEMPTATKHERSL